LESLDINPSNSIFETLQAQWHFPRRPAKTLNDENEPTLDSIDSQALEKADQSSISTAQPSHLDLVPLKLMHSALGFAATLLYTTFNKLKFIHIQTCARYISLLLFARPW
jgi:hypothetical protein